MKTYVVTSSNIKSVGYDIETKELTIRFHDGAQYLYKEVRAEEVVRLLFSDSIGKEFHRNIKQHDSIKL